MRIGPKLSVVRGEALKRGCPIEKGDRRCTDDVPSPTELRELRWHTAEPLSSVSSLEVHFDLLDLTELTDMSDQELAEVFADSDEENHNESPAGHHQPPLPRGGYMRSPSWTRCSKAEPPRERKHHSDSDTTAGPLMKLERPKQP
ncbi:dysbindin domain-containing protein 1-like isoform X3 [Oncorhynchus clarkii lewisi]|uniref:dysbindin domain-containing protein 1-like isoform X3 n=1 Tax=Oncorhynchus clarkii lewisi TaxID=490388 RepID=UPI0039B9961B